MARAAGTRAAERHRSGVRSIPCERAGRAPVKKPPRHIRPKQGTLWRAMGNDAEQVEQAKRRLLELLKDPYGYEAFQEIRRETPHLFRGLDGKPPPRGRRAALWQYGAPKKEEAKRTRGKPAKNWAALEPFARSVQSFIASGRASSIVEGVAKLILDRMPNADPRKVKVLATKIAQAIYEYRRWVKGRRG